jgi:hypothetical protein
MSTGQNDTTFTRSKVWGAKKKPTAVLEFLVCCSREKKPFSLDAQPKPGLLREFYPLAFTAREKLTW